MYRQSPLRLGLAAALLAPLLPLAGCAGGGDSGPNQSPLVMAKAPTKSGDAQEGIVGEVLGNPLRVIITRDGEPVENVDVDWQAGNDGEVNPGTSDTDAAGIAQTVWTLGPVEGEQGASARVTDAEGSPVSFTATASEPNPPPGVTVQVLTFGGNRFEPADVTILVNQTVTWEWPAGSIGHNVVPDDGAIPQTSGAPADGPRTYAYTFTVPGVYRYYCDPHGDPNGVGMSGTVTVEAIAP